jgi:hypothetical protein
MLTPGGNVATGAVGKPKPAAAPTNAAVRNLRAPLHRTDRGLRLIGALLPSHDRERRDGRCRTVTVQPHRGLRLYITAATSVYWIRLRSPGR